jgi:ATP-binding cassette, subfamily B, bacterial
MSPKPTETAEEAKKRLLAAEEEAKRKRAAAKKKAEGDDEDDEDDEDEDEEEEDEDDELSPHVVSASETRNALVIMVRFLKPFLPKHKKGLGLILIAILIETAYNTAFPLALKFLIDDAIEGDSAEVLFWILGVMFVMGVVSSVVMVWFEWLNAKTGAAIISDIRTHLFAHAQELPLDYYHREKAGVTLQRFSSDISELEETVNYGAQWGVLPVFELIAGLILLFVLNWQLALLASLLFPIALLAPRRFARRAVDASYEFKKNEASALGVVQEVLTSMPVVKAFGLRRRAVGWFDERNRGIEKEMRQLTWSNGLVERSITISVLALHLLVLAVGAWLAFNEQITIGTFVTFESVFWELSYNVGHITQFIPVLIEGSGAARHIDDFLKEPIRNVDKPNAQPLAKMEKGLAFENVTFSYDGKQNHLDGLDLAIPAGSRVAIVGRSGAGKSTIMNLLLRLYDPSVGKVTIDGTDIADVTRDSLRSQMAVVFQDNILFNLSVMENVRLGNAEATDEQVIAACKAAEIHKFITGLPEGYDTIVGERGSTVSGGQRQRLAIARALVRNPTLLLLDEATSALDQTTERQISRTINKVAKGRTVVSVTHRLTSVTEMDVVYVLDRGKLAEQGTHAELLKKRGGLYAKMWKDQIGQARRDEEDDED